MKLHRPAAVLAAAVILATGAVVAVNAVTATSPVTLCSNNRNGAVTVPVDGACAKGTTGFSVANDSDVQAVAGRIDTVEPAVEALEVAAADQAARIAELETKVAALMRPGEITVTSEPLSTAPGFYRVSITGSGLEPETNVIKEYEQAASDEVLGQVGEDGSFSRSTFHNCEDGPFRISAQRERDWGTITTPWYRDAPC